MALHILNRNADHIQNEALLINIRAAVSLKDILKTNLGPNGKLKMLVSGSGDITLTKDGCVLLKQMQIEHPTASMIARNAVAQDDITGDGSTSLIVFIGEILQHSLPLFNDGIHPRNISQGIEIARKISLDFLNQFVSKIDDIEDRELLCNVARTSLRTKLPIETADHLTDLIVDSVLTIKKPGKPIDLYMVELMTMEHKTTSASELVKGLVLDHGFRHPLMPKVNENCHILTCNISLEYEKTEVNSQFYFNNAEQRAEMVKAERSHVDAKLMAIVALKNKVCKENETFVVINQKGIDPISLDFLHKNGIVALRRAKRRNMERLTQACGGHAVNFIEALTPSSLGRAKKVTERILNGERFTFVEQPDRPLSVTLLLRGPNGYTIRQMKDAVRDGQRAVLHALQDKRLVAGAGAFEVACHNLLQAEASAGRHGKNSLGVKAFAEGLLALPKTLAVNSGLDPLSSVLKVVNAIGEPFYFNAKNLENSTKNNSNLENSNENSQNLEKNGQNLDKKAKIKRIGLCLETGGTLSPENEGIWDSYRAKRQLINLGAVMAENLLVVDEIIRAGKVERKE